MTHSTSEFLSKPRHIEKEWSKDYSIKESLSKILARYPFPDQYKDLEAEIRDGLDSEPLAESAYHAQQAQMEDPTLPF